MAATTFTNAGTHPAIRALMARKGLEPGQLRSDGRLVLTIDRKYRVQLLTGSSNTLIIVAQLLPLWDRLHERATQDRLDALLRTAVGMLKAHASTLSLDEQQQALVLQQVLPPDTDVTRLEAELAEFINALSFWICLCAEQNPQ